MLFLHEPDQQHLTCKLRGRPQHPSVSLQGWHHIRHHAVAQHLDALLPHSPKLLPPMADGAWIHSDDPVPQVGVQQGRNGIEES